MSSTPSSLIEPVQGLEGLEAHRDRRDLRRERRLLGSRAAAGGRSLGSRDPGAPARDLTAGSARFVDHRSYDTTSILATIERRFGLAPLTDRDAEANDLRHAFKPSEDGG